MDLVGRKSSKETSGECISPRDTESKRAPLASVPVFIGCVVRRGILSSQNDWAHKDKASAPPPTTHPMKTGTDTKKGARLPKDDPQQEPHHSQRIPNIKTFSQHKASYNSTFLPSRNNKQSNQASRK